MVEPSPSRQGGEEFKIESVTERQNAIFRNIPREQKKKVIASNVDVMLVVMSAGKPSYKRGLVDRYLARSDYWNVPAFVVFNKMDLYDPNEFELNFEADRLQWLNVECFEVSAEKPDYKPQYLQNGFEELSNGIRRITGFRHRTNGQRLQDMFFRFSMNIIHQNIERIADMERVCGNGITKFLRKCAENTQFFRIWRLVHTIHHRIAWVRLFHVVHKSCDTLVGQQHKFFNQFMRILS